MMIFDGVINSDLKKVRRLNRVLYTFATLTETKITLHDLSDMNFIGKSARLKVNGHNSERSYLKEQANFSNLGVYISAFYLRCKFLTYMQGQTSNWV